MICKKMILNIPAVVGQDEEHTVHGALLPDGRFLVDNGINQDLLWSSIEEEEVQGFDRPNCHWKENGIVIISQDTIDCAKDLSV